MSDPITVRILLFATLRERAGQREVTLTLPAASTLAGLRALLVAEYPSLVDSLPNALASVNKEYAFDEELIPANAEVAFFPPVSGGDFPTFCAITETALDLDELLAQITLPSTGAAAIFSGMVRGITSRDDPHETLYLEYEAYQPMAEAKMQQVAAEIRERWTTIEGIALVQRVGRLYPLTPTIVVACTAAHRDTGVFEAARYGIDRMKEIVPVWKKEVGPGGETWVEGDYTPKPGE